MKSICNYFENGRFDEALNFFKKDILGRDAQEWDYAIEHFKKAIELYPSMVMVFLELGRAYYEKGEGYSIMDKNRAKAYYERAKQFFTRSIELDPQFKLGYYHRASAYDRLDVKDPIGERARKDIEIYEGLMLNNENFIL